jgi:hypothetical protein
MWFSFALVFLGALFDNLPTIQAFLDPKVYSYTLMAIGVIVAVLRYLTTTPLEDK